MIDLLQHISIDRLLVLIFAIGSLWERFKAGERSRRSQGERLGALGKEIGELRARLAALEAFRGRA